VKTSKNIQIPSFERPVRIPEHITILPASPTCALAGEKSSWRLLFKLSESVEPNAWLRIQVYGGRNNPGKFSPLQTENPEGEGYVSARIADGHPLEMKGDFSKTGINKFITRGGDQFLTMESCYPTLGHMMIKAPAAGLQQATVIEVVIGDCSQGGAGITVTDVGLLNKFFVLYKPCSDEDRDRPIYWGPDNWNQIVGACSIHILGNSIERLRLYGPSQCLPGEPLTLLVRPEDVYGNLSSERPAGLKLFLAGQELPVQAMEISETTCLRFSFTLTEEGVFRPEVRDSNGRTGICNPIVCRRDTGIMNAYWGMIHGHTENSDGAGSIKHYFHQIRDEAGLDFAASGDHDHVWETSEDMWQTISKTVAEWNVPSNFVTFLGYEWAKWRQNGDGDRNVYYLEDLRPICRSDIGHCPTSQSLFSALKNEKAIIIPHHTGCQGNWCDWKDHSPEHERLVEIYQMRGSYECENDNPLPDIGQTTSVGFVDQALKQGWRVGFTAGGDDHTGHAGTEFPIGGPYWGSGLMAVWATELDRPSIWDGLWNRRVTATSGARIYLTCHLNDQFIGSELSTADFPKLAEVRNISIEFHGTAPASRIEIMLNSKVLKTFSSPGLDCELNWEDTAELRSILLPSAKYCSNPFCYYYVRAVQNDGHVAWTSPIWIDKN
jgi:Protein of unknown function (DUF3604)